MVFSMFRRGPILPVLLASAMDWKRSHNKVLKGVGGTPSLPFLILFMIASSSTMCWFCCSESSASCGLRDSASRRCLCRARKAGRSRAARSKSCSRDAIGVVCLVVLATRRFRWKLGHSGRLTRATALNHCGPDPLPAALATSRQPPQQLARRYGVPGFSFRRLTSLGRRPALRPAPCPLTAPAPLRPPTPHAATVAYRGAGRVPVVKGLAAAAAAQHRSGSGLMFCCPVGSGKTGPPSSSTLARCNAIENGM